MLFSFPLKVNFEWKMEKMIVKRRENLVLVRKRLDFGESVKIFFLIRSKEKHCVGLEKMGRN